MRKFLTLFVLVLVSLLIWQCHRQKDQPMVHLRGLTDTVGYAHTARQMDSLIGRIDRLYGKERKDILKFLGITPEFSWQVVICPHDDYSYAGDLYPYVMENLSASTVILFGVAHGVRKFGVEDQIVFDSFTHWRGPYGKIPVSSVREELMQLLPEDYYQVNDSLQQVEHSVEGLLPFLQYYHRQIEIVPILVPYMNYQRMEQISRELARAIHQIMTNRNWNWGNDIALAISNDCVHYGDQNWGGKNYAPFGADSAGFRAAANHDLDIISECLIDHLHPQGLQRFVDYTVKKENYKEYAWTWCGRYSVPFGLLTAYHLQKVMQSKRHLIGRMLRYSTSLMHPPIPVKDLGMGVTAPANIHHWVGYVTIGYNFE